MDKVIGFCCCSKFVRMIENGDEKLGIVHRNEFTLTPAIIPQKVQREDNRKEAILRLLGR